MSLCKDLEVGNGGKFLRFYPDFYKKTDENGDKSLRTAVNTIDIRTWYLQTKVSARLKCR
jgi:hypothetical protein